LQDREGAAGLYWASRLQTETTERRRPRKGLARLSTKVQRTNRKRFPILPTGWGGGWAANDPGPNLGKLYQHQMNNVLSSMEDVVTKDREAMKDFLKKWGSTG